MSNDNSRYPVEHYEGLTDARYTITNEHVGHSLNGKPCKVLRFCDDFISRHDDYEAAVQAAHDYKAMREAQ